MSAVFISRNVEVSITVWFSSVSFSLRGDKNEKSLDWMNEICLGIVLAESSDMNAFSSCSKKHFLSCPGSREKRIRIRIKIRIQIRLAPPSEHGVHRNSQKNAHIVIGLFGQKISILMLSDQVDDGH